MTCVKNSILTSGVQTPPKNRIFQRHLYQSKPLHQMNLRKIWVDLFTDLLQFSSHPLRSCCSCCTNARNVAVNGVALLCNVLIVAISSWCWWCWWWWWWWWWWISELWNDHYHHERWYHQPHYHSPCLYTMHPYVTVQCIRFQSILKQYERGWLPKTKARRTKSSRPKGHKAGR